MTPEIRHQFERRELLGSPGYWEEEGPDLVLVDRRDVLLLLGLVRGVEGCEGLPGLVRLARVVDG